MVPAYGSWNLVLSRHDLKNSLGNLGRRSAVLRYCYRRLEHYSSNQSAGSLGRAHQPRLLPPASSRSTASFNQIRTVVGRPSQSHGFPSNGLCCLVATEIAAETSLGTVCTHRFSVTDAKTCRQGFICHGCLPLPYASQRKIFPKYWIRSNK
jgi:hypothetical protein